MAKKRSKRAQGNKGNNKMSRAWLGITIWQLCLLTTLVPLSLLSSSPPDLLDPSTTYWSAEPRHNASVIPEPLSVLMEYQQLHSVQALKQQPEHRKYAIGLYSCPLQAGNRLHVFFNSLLWAMLTNRTMLWNYTDHDACHREYVPRSFCKFANTKRDCDKVLTLASWIPSYDEWAVPLGLDNEEPELLSHMSTHTKDTNQQHPVVIFPPMVARSRWMAEKEKIQLFMRTDYARQTAYRLVKEGAEFFYGMLFRHTFQINDEVNIINDATNMRVPSFSVALHSRHENVTSDGSNITYEIQCLDTILQNTTTGPCQVYLLSDRASTLIKLQEWLKESYPNCRTRVADHDSNTSWRAEHGPWAGQGYFQDLALAVKARNGFVGTVRNESGRYRSSSDLVLELIEYDRRMEAYRNGKLHVEPLPQCKLYA